MDRRAACARTGRGPPAPDGLTPPRGRRPAAPPRVANVMCIREG
jgi:hypothetical protein